MFFEIKNRIIEKNLVQGYASNMYDTVYLTREHEKEFKKQRDISQGSFSSFRKCDKYHLHFKLI